MDIFTDADPEPNPYPESNTQTKLLPWSEKYRPESTADIISHEKIIDVITKYIESNTLPHLLFYGPAGTGKTSTILAIARKYYYEDFENMVMILNASQERGIETVRNRIKQFVTTFGMPKNPKTLPFKLIILDEIDAMTDDAQAILRKVIEKHVSNVRFCFICNYLKKINPAIQSRCIIFRFKPVSREYLIGFVTTVCENENIQITSNALDLVIRRAGGDMRKLLNVLQSVYMYNQTLMGSGSGSGTGPPHTIKIKESSVSKILSCPTDKKIRQILNSVQTEPLVKSYLLVKQMVLDDGIVLGELIDFIYEYFINSIIECDTSVIKYPITRSTSILKNMSIVNENLVNSNDENIQLVSFISVFYL